jgi:hypothetical protein
MGEVFLLLHSLKESNMQQMTADFAIHRSIQGLRYIYICI